MLAWLWPAQLAFGLAAYLVLDGFDLGAGILSGLTTSASRRIRIVASIAPVWDGLGIWLMTAGTLLFGVFPAIYSISLPALHAPLAAILAGLLVRGIALEFRRQTHASPRVWHPLLFAGSLLAAFAQGVAIGTCVKSVPFGRISHVGNELAWASVFPLWCGVGAALCYALLGAGWLALQGDPDLQRFACAALGRLTPLTIGVLAAMFAAAFAPHATLHSD
ncbi:hypothetical protein C0Z18_13270 [Trinickia dabaoshanensis]|uniref:Cytochrome d ubiquinol oxidase subunit II n=1 Tax=Trinickia dabaoshanensis TaxID=564714 RepID=A0A2N7VRK3_9BURK|nr:cytochrome d ubiquinol oxidase subunit II [Trinickia dabaoshanensis]PMS19787.1 hypothetical protein C0Z18_13270 [Trinickia dabaoshanensis]